MLQNAYFLAKIGADAAENEQHFAEILPILGAAAAGDVEHGAVRRLDPALREGRRVAPLRGRGERPLGCR